MITTGEKLHELIDSFETDSPTAKGLLKILKMMVHREDIIETAVTAKFVPTHQEERIDRILKLLEIKIGMEIQPKPKKEGK